MQLIGRCLANEPGELRVCGVRHEGRVAASAAALFFFPQKQGCFYLLSATQAPARIPCGKIQWFSCIGTFTVACCLARNQLLFFPPRPLPKKYSNSVLAKFLCKINDESYGAFSVCPVFADCFCFWQTSCGFSLSFFKRMFRSSDCCSRFFIHSSSISYTALPSMISLVDIFFPFINYCAARAI